jgi:hypothetical protein
MFYKIWKGNKLTKQSSKNYDIVVRLRTDLVHDSNIKLEINDYINTNNGLVYIGDWKNCVGIHDVFAYGSPKNMDYYSSVYLFLDSYTKDGVYVYPPENILRHHLAVGETVVRFFPSTIRKDIPLPNEDYIINAKEICELEQDPNLTFYKQF